MTCKPNYAPNPHKLLERVLKRKHGLPESFARAIADLRHGGPDK